MPDTNGFVDALHAANFTVLDEVIATAWFLNSSEQNRIATVSEAVNFLAEHGVRLNVNASRVRTQLRLRPNVSIRGLDELYLNIGLKKDLEDKFKAFLDEKPLIVSQNVLNLSAFEDHPKYIQKIARQINACYATHSFDACAVMQRRLAESLIILLFNKKNLRPKILDGQQNYKMLEGLILALNSESQFKLARGTTNTLNRIKSIGDRAAHSYSHITSKLDIDGYSADFRAAVGDLSQLQD